MQMEPLAASRVRPAASSLAGRQAGGHCCRSLYCKDISGTCCCVGRKSLPLVVPEQETRVSCPFSSFPHFPPLPHIPALPSGPCIPLQKPPHLPPRLPEPPWAVLGAAWDLGRGGGHHGLSEGMKGREGQEAGSVPAPPGVHLGKQMSSLVPGPGPQLFSPCPCLTISPHPHPEPLSLH